VAKSVLITGGAGFIGCKLGERLVASGYDVTALDVLHPQVHTGFGRPADLPEGVQLIAGDVTHPATWETVLKLVRPDIVVHLAAETGTGQSLMESSRHGMVNVVGTTRMLDAFSAAGHVPERFVLASSRAVYGEGAWQLDDGTLFYPSARSHSQLTSATWDPIHPSGGPVRPVASVAGVTPPHPSNIYAATKLTQEHLLTAWSAAMGSSVSTLRLQNVYGPGQSLTNSYTGVVALFARLSVAQQAIDIYEDGTIVRDFVHVEDVAAALEAAVKSPLADSVLADIGYGQPTTILEAASILAALAGAPSPVVSGRFRDGDVRAAYCAIDVAAERLGYSPAVSLEAGLSSLLDWVRTQPSLPKDHAKQSKEAHQ
jgi:dTDP-L-rhamnose 4-epimerase